MEPGMQALWLADQNVSFRTDVPVPVVASGEALVRVRLAGICSTDLEMLRGYYPFTGVGGHEFVGEVVEPADAGWSGQRVVGEINVVCGTCPPCRRGDGSHCERRTVVGLKGRGGAFAQYLALPLENLHRVPAGVPDEVAVFTEPLAAALEIQQQTPVHPDDRVLVVGAGRLGQLVAQTLALTGCELSVAARSSLQRQLLTARGIQVLALEEIPERGMDVVVEATGSPDGFTLALRALRPRGVLVLKSTYVGAIPLKLSSLVVDEITLIGSRCGPFAPALRLLESGQVDPRPLITARYPLSQGVAALEHAARPGVLKVLLQPEISA